MKQTRYVVQLVLILLAAGCLPACHAWRPEPEPPPAAREPLRSPDRRTSQSPRERFFFNDKSREIEESLGL